MTTSLPTADYQKLLQKIAVLEKEVHHLRVNLGVNEQCRKQDSRAPDKKAAWSSLGAKPKDWLRPKNVYNISTVITSRENNVQRLTGRTRSPVKSDWPPLPSPLSTPPKQWKLVKNSARKPPAERMEILQLSNKFSPLLQTDSDDRDIATPNMVRRPNSVKMTLDDCLIVGDEAIKHVKGSGNRKVKVLCFPKDTVSDMNDRISDLVAGHPTVKRLILHIGARDTERQQSEILKKNFTALFQTLSALNVEVYISGPLPPMRGSERFSRLFGLNEWLSTACRENCFIFIDNFNEFYDRRHLFCPDGLQLNKLGLRLLLGNIWNSMLAPSHSKATAQRSSLNKTDNRDKTEDSVLAGAISPPPCKAQPAMASKADVHACVRACVANLTTRDATAPPGGEIAKSSNPANGEEKFTVTAPPDTATSDGEEDSTDGEEDSPDGDRFSGYFLDTTPWGQRGRLHLYDDLKVSPPVGEEVRTVHMYSPGGITVTVTTSPGGEDQTEATIEAAERSSNDSQEKGFQTPSPLHLLDFTPKMKCLINAGVKMSPAPLLPKPLTWLERHQDRRRQLEASPIPRLSWGCWQEQPRQPEENPTQLSRLERRHRLDAALYMNHPDGPTLPYMNHLDSPTLSPQLSPTPQLSLENTFDY